MFRALLAHHHGVQYLYEACCLIYLSVASGTAGNSSIECIVDGIVPSNLGQLVITCFGPYWPIITEYNTCMKLVA